MPLTPAQKAWRTRRRQTKKFKVRYWYGNPRNRRYHYEIVEARNASEARMKVEKTLQRRPLSGAVVSSTPLQ